MMITRRAVVAGLSASGAFPYVAQAAWPERPITMLHGFAPGGGADANARIAAEGLSKVLGQTVVVESKTGAGTTLASAQLVRAAPDGYTIALVATSYCASACRVLHDQSGGRPGSHCDRTDRAARARS